METWSVIFSVHMIISSLNSFADLGFWCGSAGRGGSQSCKLCWSWSHSHEGHSGGLPPQTGAQHTSPGNDTHTHRDWSLYWTIIRPVKLCVFCSDVPPHPPDQQGLCVSETVWSPVRTVLDSTQHQHFYTFTLLLSLKLELIYVQCKLLVLLTLHIHEVQCVHT